MPSPTPCAPVSPSFASPPVTLAALFLLCVIQGMAGRPAPPGLRWVEMLIAACALVAVGWRPLRDLAMGGLLALDRPNWVRRGALCLFILIWVPLFRGALADWRVEDMVRDLIPLGFLFLPLMLAPAIATHGRRLAIWLAAGLTIEGVALTLRWWRHADWGFGALGLRALADGGAYLLNAPSVLFAAVILPVLALRLAAGPGWWPKAGAVAAAGAAVPCAAALLGAVHRLALALMAVAIVIALVMEWRRRRGSPVTVVALAVVSLLVVGQVGDRPMMDRLADAFGHVAQKTRLAGENGRLAEAEAALTLAGSDPASALFGRGWGALIENPAVGGWRVSYTHSVFTYMLVKGGVVGLAALIVWFATLAPAAAAAWRRDPAVAFAILAPLITAFSLHTSFKYLDTGLILTLLVAISDFKIDKNDDCIRVHTV